MKDPVSANFGLPVQHIMPRRRPSLLSTAARFRVSASPRNQSLEGAEYLTAEAAEKIAIRQRIPLRFKLARLFHHLGNFIAKKSVFIVVLALLGILLAVLLAVSFIPEPEPPEINAPQGRFANASAAIEAESFPLDLTENFAWQHYTVASGDTVEAIARRFGLSLDAVIASNGIRNVRSLRAGDRIRIPNIDGIPYTVKAGDSYSRIAAQFDVPLEAILDANDIQSEAITAGTVLFIPGAKMKSEELRDALGNRFIWPVKGRQTSPFGWRIDPISHTRLWHAGIDLSSNTGTPVKAAAAGKVSAAGWSNVYGNFVIVTHSGGIQTMYGHLSSIRVKKGAQVAQGGIVGLVGSTGRSTGPHLHFSVYKNGRAVNPLEILKN
jgi:murein DD-endopeptidase MepM/ murein hydrolase activator NlpD